MKTEIQNLENKINALVLRVNESEEKLNISSANEFNCFREDLDKLINELDGLKIKVKIQGEKTDKKIDQEIIEEIVSLIDEYITECGTDNFTDYSFIENDISDVELSISYDNKVELESANIDIKDYFCDNFLFNYDDFTDWIENTKDEEKRKLIHFVNRELFELIEKIVNRSVQDIDSNIRFDRFDDFDCEIDSYKNIEVTDVRILSYEFNEAFYHEFVFNSNDIENIIKNFHNFISEENSEE